MFTSGSRLGPYEIVAPIGAGGMGQVFRARDTRLGREVAIKVIAGEHDANLERRLEREAKTISRLSHPHICTLYDVGQVDGSQYLVMEYLEGETLAERLRKGPLPLDQVLRFGTEIADALHAAHRQGVVHRDLKPGNVMLTRTGTKLLDFGLARRMTIAASDDATAQKSMTEAGALVGTFAYMSPEQLEGREADARSDIFAFGALLYEMTTGRRAHDGSTPASLIASIMNSVPVPLRELQPHAPPALERLVRMCLQKDPEERWQSAKDLADELRWIATSSEAAASAYPQRRWRAWLAGFLALAAVASLAALVLWRGAPQTGVASRVVVLMDSTNPERIYSSITRAHGGTNADDLTNLLRDLPITIIKENTSAQWNREDQLIKERPGLIVIHRSAFVTPRSLVADQATYDYVWLLGDGHMRAFIGYAGLASPETRFVVYSRRWDIHGPASAWVADMEKRFPHLRRRLFTFDIRGQPEASFRDPETAEEMRRRVTELLRLDAVNR